MRLPRNFYLWLWATSVILVTWVCLLVVAASLIVSRFVPLETPIDHRWIGVTGIAGLLIAVVVVLAVLWRPRKTTLAVLTAIPIALISFLSIDDSAPGAADLGSRASPEDPVFQVAMWMTDAPEFSRVNELSPPAGSDTLRLPTETADWDAFVAKNKSGIESAWASMDVGRDWLTTLAGLDSKNVWSSVNNAGLDFKAVRQITNCALLHALVLASDGDVNDALYVVTTVVRATQTLQRSAPLLVNQMICTVVMRQSLSAAAQITHRHTVSEQRRNELRDVLNAAPPLELIARNAFEGEAEWTSSIFDRVIHGSGTPRAFQAKPDEARVWQLRCLGPFVLNYNHTLSQLSGTYRDMERLCANRRSELLEKFQPRHARGLQQFKNPVGRVLGAMILPAFETPVAKIWAVQDQRVTLLKELKGSEVSIPAKDGVSE